MQGGYEADPILVLQFGVLLLAQLPIRLVDQHQDARSAA